MRLPVRRQRPRLCEPVPTHLTLIRLLPRMDAHVRLQALRIQKRLIARPTNMVPLARMTAYVHSEMTRRFITLRTVGAHKRFLTGMQTLVCFQIARSCTRFTAGLQ